MQLTKQAVINRLQEMEPDEVLLQNLWSQIQENQEKTQNSKKTKTLPPNFVYDSNKKCYHLKPLSSNQIAKDFWKKRKNKPKTQVLNQKQIDELSYLS